MLFVHMCILNSHKHPCLLLCTGLVDVTAEPVSLRGQIGTSGSHVQMSIPVKPVLFQTLLLSFYLSTCLDQKSWSQP